MITETLSHAGVTFSAAYRGERADALDGNHPMDAWVCTFTRGEKSITFDYFTGLGHRKLPEWRGPGPAPRTGTLLHAQWVAQAKPQAPSPADVLHCLLSDAEACGQSFKSWCDDFGCDTDSRKAFATYEACQRSGDELRGFFTRETLECFASDLRDY
jgi:hypothetical protein